MRRSHSLRVVGSSLAVVFAGLALGGPACTAGGPFYLVPAPTKECANVANCEAESGPWVVVPARGEATYLIACPTRRTFIVGGTDARASSPGIRVWFDGQLGAAGGFPAIGNPTGAALLFHAVASDGSEGSFQPILGCVSLRSETKIATVAFVRPLAATPGVAAGAPLDLRATIVVIAPQGRSVTRVGCGANEQLVGSWSAVALQTLGPPARRYLSGITVKTTVAHGTVFAVFAIKPLMLKALAPRSWVQVGAMCQQ
jgi:hypothetical protein